MRRSSVRRTPAPNSGWRRTDLLEDGDRPQARARLFKHRHDLAVPDGGQRIGSAPLARRFLLRRQSRILLDAVGGGGAEPGLGGGDDRGVGLTETHVQPHLVIGDVAAGQAAVPHRREEPFLSGRPRPPERAPFGGTPLAGFATSSRATPSRRHDPRDTFSSRLTRLLILIVAR